MEVKQMSRNKKEIRKELLENSSLGENDFTASGKQLTRSGLLKLERLLVGEKGSGSLQNHIQTKYSAD